MGMWTDTSCSTACSFVPVYYTHGIVCLQQQEDLPVSVQPGSPETSENNPFLSSLQQSGISMTGLSPAIPILSPSHQPVMLLCSNILP